MLLESSKAPLAQILVAYWGAVGIDVKLDVKEMGVWRSITRKKAHEEMSMYVSTNVHPRGLRNFGTNETQNQSFINDARANEIHDVLIPKLQIVKNAELDKILKEFFPYALEQAWWVETPNPYVYTFWQPWVKGYGGEWGVGVCNRLNFPIWIWADMDQKKMMAGK